MCALGTCVVYACASSLYMCLNVNMWKCVFLSVNERCVCAYTQMCISLCECVLYVCCDIDFMCPLGLNRMRQFLVINLFIHTHTLLPLFVWRTLTHTFVQVSVPVCICV